MLIAIDKPFILLDIDNCIADDSWRIQHIRWDEPDQSKRYHKYHQLSPWDKVHNKELFERQKRHIVIMTSRPYAYEHMTRFWLHQAGCLVAIIKMRRNDDHRPSLEVKEEQLNELGRVHNIFPKDIHCAHDDREDIIDMYRKNGIDAERVCIHDVCAYTNTLTGEKHG